MRDLGKEVAVLDLGTSKICCAIARANKGSHDLNDVPQGVAKNIRVLGSGYQMAKGIKRFSITNLEDLEDSLAGAISTAEGAAGRSIKSALIALPSWAIKSHRVENSIDVSSVTIDDVHINYLLDIDQSKCVDESREVVHIFPVYYVLDSNCDIQDPIGMTGSNLSCVIHVMTAPKTLLNNVRNCLVRQSVEPEGFMSSTYASGLAVLIDEEIENGVTLIDIGGATTSIACYYDRTLLYLGCIPVGGDNVTNDIAMVLRTNKSDAERLKIMHGSANIDSHSGEQIFVSRVDEYGEEHVQNISKGYLDSIINARVIEILELAQEHISNKAKADPIVCKRIVITGGGSKISGLMELIKKGKYFDNSNVRLGKPIGVVGAHEFVQSAPFASTAGAISYRLGQFINNQYLNLASGKKTFAQKLITWFKRGV